MASVEIAAEQDGETRLVVGQNVELVALVTAARSSTELISFSYEPPSLSELFRQAVGV